MMIFFMTALLTSCGGSSSGGGGGGVTDTTAPAVTKTTPENGGVILTGDSITVNFDEPVDSSSVVLGGNMGSEADGTVTKSTVSSRDIRIQSDSTGTTLTIAPQTTWTTGNDRTITIDAKDTSGNSLQTLNLMFNVVNGIVYVSPTGDDNNDGTKDSPRKTVRGGITRAVAMGFTPRAVLVAQGSYAIDSSAKPPAQVVLTEGISLYGGFSADFSQRDPENNITTIQDISTAAASSSLPNRAIEAGSGVTTATVVNGFTIQGGGGQNSSGVFTHDGGSPTLVDNTINGGRGTDFSYGILNVASSPSIQNNAIDGEGRRYGLCFGIFNITFSSPSIRNNTINGGVGEYGDSYGIYNRDSSSPLIQNNTINGGGGTDGSSYGIYNLFSSSPWIQDNSIMAGGGSIASGGIRNESSSPSIINNIIVGGGGSL